MECLNVRNINWNEKSFFNLLLCTPKYVHFHSYLKTSAPTAYGCNNRDFFRIFGLKSSITLSVTFASIEQIWIPFPHFSVAALNISTRRQNKDPGSWILMVKYRVYQSELVETKWLWGIERPIQRVPALRVFWDLKKTVLDEIRVSGTVLWSSTNANSPTYTYISQKTC